MSTPPRIASAGAWRLKDRKDAQVGRRRSIACCGHTLLADKLALIKPWRGNAKEAIFAFCRANRATTMSTFTRLILSLRWFSL